MSDFPKGPQADAAGWLARLRADDRTQADIDAFHRWLDADPRHGEHFERLSTIFDDVGGLKESIRRPEKAGQPNLTRRSVLAGACVLAVSASGLIAWDDAQARIYQTAIGEQKRVTLSDGSVLLLDTATRLEECFDADDRLLKLCHGRINCVVPRGQRPFVVEVGNEMLRTEAGRFDIRHEGDVSAYIAQEGRAVIRSEDTAQHVKIASGERVREEKGHFLRDRPEVMEATAWQSGRAVFRNDTLREALGEMNRYSMQSIQLADPAMADLRISGIYRVGDNRAFAKALANILPVKARITDGNILLLSA
ncbi:DUF4880 domain-containing protein [Altericroceibacterium endophyticum]|uniref:DUF4880 domain-containing protein n=1 Tax=Altericroceibacterium endophyticum TaxID=1808508 RepID=UPI00136E62B1